MDNIIDSIEKQLSELHRESSEMLTDFRNLQRRIRDTETPPDITKDIIHVSPENDSAGCKYVVLDNDVNKAWAEFISLYNKIKYPDYHSAETL